ncbi:TPA: ATP-binding protein [Escherichia coli]|uniref:BbrUII/HgiDII family restriction enzyme n=1 Tax=Escherichia coli TaxID=562 RepID=UPI00178CE8E6|nr:ATP-binding protein [Escherichia coli]MBE1668318.1 ATP-binding protein [Escherichia coli]HBE5328645.1 ATP-binding protein [Escherichia coli]HBE5618287.1 ATP-binding protein [Escherichia coli]HDV8003972.1 ATP-binding protein [Escherichia coli]
MSDFEIKIDLNVLNHLGMSLYSNTPAVLTEIISNAWDADAQNVEITLDVEKGEVIIKDDGHGMSKDDIINKFLKVGYARREHGRAKSDHLKRQVMGRKGIGKLAMFSLANKIQVYSYKKGEQPQAFEVDVKDLQQSIKESKNYIADSLEIPENLAYGTTIKLFELKKAIDRTQTYLRKRIARRFSIIGPNHNFTVKINGTDITPADRDFLSDLEFIWEFGESDPERIKSCTNITQKNILPNTITFEGKDVKVSGYIGSVVKPSQLKKDPEISNNSITVISHGRVFEEDILLEFGSAKVFTNYLVGEIVADFLDDNEKPDMATSSRQKLQQNDPRYPVLKGFLERTLQLIDKDWDKWRREKGVNEVKINTPIVSEWLNSLKKHERESAEKLIGRVNTFRFSGNEEEQKAARKTVLKNTVLAFERLRIQDNLDALDKISNLQSENFKDVFASVNDIEASMFYEITSQRLKVIEKFQKITDENQLERAVQMYLYDHLWLLDPSWERVTGTSVMEQTLTKELKQINPDAASGARIDIAFKTVSGKHVIIEMKRPKVHPDIMNLVAQGNKYVQATTQWFSNNPKNCPGGNIPHIEVIFLVGSGYLQENQHFINMQLLSINGKILTYNDLIVQSKQAYAEYQDKKNDAARIMKIVEGI